MNKLHRKARAQILGMMVEGMSMQSITRMTGVSKNTVAKLLVDAGTVCAEYQDRVMRNLTCKTLQCDEIWSFVGMKEKNVPAALKGVFVYGDVYTWTAIDADTKLIPCWHVGARDAWSANDFMRDLAPRIASRVQMTTDGLKAYIRAINGAFGADVDYAMLVKLYGPAPGSGPERRYSQGECCGAIRETICGNPKYADVSTSYVERANLSMRMGMRRFTRLTNGFSKKIDNHMHAIAIYFMHYNFVRIHQSLRVSPAMAAKVSETLWSLEDMAALIEANEAPPKKRGSYKKKFSN